VTVSLLLLAAAPGRAFPPAPHHLVHGMVRDEYGTPINLPGAQVILQTATGRRLKTVISSILEPGVNYRLEVPMDAGLAGTEPYNATAMRPAMPFQLVVVINGRTNLPIELRGNFSKMGQPGKRSQMDLTLGEDTDGDGLPDAWERIVDGDISKVEPGDLRPSGLTNLQSYRAGIYPMDDSGGFQLAVSGFRDGEPLLNFLGIQGRAYSLLGSSDLSDWQPVKFRLPAEGPAAAPRSFYPATAVGPVEVQVVTAGHDPVPAFFKLTIE